MRLSLLGKASHSQVRDLAAGQAAELRTLGETWPWTSETGNGRLATR